MAFSRTEPMYYLLDFRGVKAGTPVKLNAGNLSRFRLLAAKGVVGTKVDMDSESKTQERVAAMQEETPEVPEEEPKDKPQSKKRGKKKR